MREQGPGQDSWARYNKGLIGHSIGSRTRIKMAGTWVWPRGNLLPLPTPMKTRHSSGLRAPPWERTCPGSGELIFVSDNTGPVERCLFLLAKGPINSQRSHVLGGQIQGPPQPGSPGPQPPYSPGAEPWLLWALSREGRAAPGQLHLRGGAAWPPSVSTSSAASAASPLRASGQWVTTGQPLVLDTWF